MVTLKPYVIDCMFEIMCGPHTVKKSTSLCEQRPPTTPMLARPYIDSDLVHHNLHGGRRRVAGASLPSPWARLASGTVARRRAGRHCAVPSRASLVRNDVRSMMCAAWTALCCALVFASAAAPAAPEVLAARQQKRDAISQHKNVCGSTKDTKNNCVRVLKSRDTDADTSSTLWLVRDAVERHVIGAAAHDSSHQHMYISLAQLRWLPDQGQERKLARHASRPFIDVALLADMADGQRVAREWTLSACRRSHATGRCQGTVTHIELLSVTACPCARIRSCEPPAAGCRARPYEPIRVIQSTEAICMTQFSVFRTPNIPYSVVS